MGFRDATIVVFETSRTFVRAGLGLQELLKPPAIEVKARVGYRGSQTGTSAPPVASTSSTSLPQRSFPGVNVHDFLVGPALDEALAADPDLPVSWPFADGDISDWIQAEAIWKYALFKGLQLRRLQMESPTLMSVPSGLSRPSHERICQIFFERFNVAAFSIIERPLAQIFATVSPTGVVVDIGDEITDVTPVYDALPINHAKMITQLGLQDCETYLAHILKTNQSIVAAGLGGDSIGERESRLELVRHLRSESKIKVPSSGQTVPVEEEGVTDIAAVVMAGKEKAIVENAVKKKNTAKASAAEQQRAREIEALDLLNLEFKGHALTIGKERHRFHEPLFNPELLSTVPEFAGRETPMSLQDTVFSSVSRTEVGYRQSIWQGLLVTGDATKTVHGLTTALQSRVQPYLAGDHINSEVQARVARTLSIPDYYTEYRESGDCYAAFLGTSITAKLTFHENIGKAYVSKTDYSEKGPHEVIVNAPAML